MSAVKTQPPTKRASHARTQKYYAALGEFYHMYTEVEHLLNMVIRGVAADHTKKGPKSTDVMAAISGGMRMSPAKDTLKRLLRVLGADAAVRDHVDAVFMQLGHIQWLRDRIAHHMTIIEYDEPYANLDFVSVKEFSKSVDLEFGLAELRDATDDMYVVQREIVSVLEFLIPRYGKSEFGQLAWQYKPERLVRDRPRSSESRG